MSAETLPTSSIYHRKNAATATTEIVHDHSTHPQLPAKRLEAEDMICSKCQQEKTDDRFAKREDGRIRRECKDCENDRRRGRRMDYPKRRLNPLHLTYQCWLGMRNRCSNSRHQSFKDYGGRGITVCHEWDSFDTFLKDMGPKPTGLEIDRIKNDEGYSKDNCRWTTRSVQCNNRRSNQVIEFAGIKKTAAEWSRHCDIHRNTLMSRLKTGRPLGLFIF